MTVQFRNLVFEGGGVKGVAYVGAMQILSQKGYLDGITRVGGTSAGAINALMYALGYDIPRQRDIISSADFKEFMDNSWFVFQDMERLWKEYGWNKGDFFFDWIGGFIKEQLGSAEATFGDLADAGGPDLYVIGTNLSTGFSEIFSRERHSDMPLAKAVRISMSIPLFYRAVHHGKRKDVYVDGGVMLNYPVKLFDRKRYIDTENEREAGLKREYYERENARFALERPGRSAYCFNRQTLGLRLETREDIGLFRYDEPLQSRKIKDFPGYVKALFSALLRVQENQHLHSDDWQRTLYIDTLDVGTTDFDISDPRKRDLIEQGIQGAQTYLDWFEGEESQPVNRIESAASTSRTELKWGDNGEEVRQLQQCMNRAGAMLAIDGDFGPATKRGVEYCQEFAGQAITGVADLSLWIWLDNLAAPFPPLDTNGVAFIAREESGGLGFYQASTRWPHYPGEQSGITIGLGYDLRHTSEEGFRSVWGKHLSAAVFRELAKDLGKAGTKRRAKVLKEAGIEIPFQLAWQVFIANTLPDYFERTKGIYPSLEHLHPLCRSALVSLVFNRGDSLRGDSRREMKAIQSLLAEADRVLPDKSEAREILRRVEEEIVSMKRLWSPSSGLIKRRQGEANLWREGLALW